jgi:hypothetical protein
MNVKVNWDGLGIATSIICAIHCALLPLVLSSLPFFGINIIHNLVFEWAMIALAFVVGCYSLYHGYIRHHRSLRPVMLFAIGFVFLTAKQFVPDYEKLFLVFAVLLIITAHYLNYRLCHKSKCNSPHHKH